MSYEVKFPALRIERRYAEAILEGRKLWEFRKRPLPLYHRTLLCLSDEADKVVGAVDFSDVVGTLRPLVLDAIRKGDYRFYSKYTGITAKWLEGYADQTDVVYAHLVGGVSRFDFPMGGEYRRHNLVFRIADEGNARKFLDTARDVIFDHRTSRYDLITEAIARKETSR